MALRAEKTSSGYVYMTARARLDSEGGLGAVSTAAPFQTVVCFRTEKPSCRWGVISLDQGVVADGQTEYVLNDGKVTECSPAGCAPQFGFLGHLLWGALMLDIDECRAARHGQFTHRRTVIHSDGRAKLHVTIEPAPAQVSGATPDTGYITTGWFDLRNAKEYVIDIETGRLEKASVYMQQGQQRVLVFETLAISYEPVERLPVAGL